MDDSSDVPHAISAYVEKCKSLNFTAEHTENAKAQEKINCGHRLTQIIRINTVKLK